MPFQDIVNTYKCIVSKVQHANPIWLIIVTGVVVGGLNYLVTGIVPGAYSQQQELVYATRRQSETLDDMATQIKEMVKFRQELIVINERITNMLTHDQRSEAKFDRLQEELRLLRERTQHLEWQMRPPESSRPGLQRAE